MTTSTPSSTAASTALVPGLAALAATLPAQQIPQVRSIPLPSDPAARADRARLRSELTRMAHALCDDPVFGGEGSLVAGVQEVDFVRLWRPERFDPIRYSEEEIEQRSAAILAADYALDEPLLVVKAIDPTPRGRGVTAPDLMIIGNALTWEAAARLNLRVLPALIKEKLSLFHAMTSIAQGFTLRHRPTPLETGRLIKRLVLSDLITRSEQPELALPKLTQRRIADLLGLAQETVSQYVRLALDTDDDLWERVENEDVPVAIAMEVRQAPLDARPALVERAIERAAGGAPMTRDEMRVEARAERDRTGVQRRKPSVSGPRVARGARPWMSERLIQPPRAEELYFPDVLAACTPPQAFCALAHDLSQWLDRFHAALLASGEAEHVDLRDLRAILARKTLRDQMQTHLADLTM